MGYSKAMYGCAVDSSISHSVQGIRLQGQIESKERDPFPRWTLIVVEALAYLSPSLVFVR